MVTFTPIVRDPDFAKRLEQACDANFHCPPMNNGRLTWIVEQLSKRFNEKVSVQTASQWMSGGAKPRQNRSAKLAQLLDVDPTWLYMGVEQALAPRERRARNAMADGAVNIVAGLIQMEGGYPAFPEDKDKRAEEEHIDLYAVIKGANYSFHVSLGSKGEDSWNFTVPSNYENLVVLGVIKDSFSFRIIELSAAAVSEYGAASGRSTIVSLPDDQIEPLQINTFAKRL